jgi:hypothetical protein
MGLSVMKNKVTGATPRVPEQAPVRRRNFFGTLAALGAVAIAGVAEAASSSSDRRRMMSELKHEHFAELVGQTFSIRHDGGSLSVTLIEAKRLGDSPRAGLRDPFSLVFRSVERDHLPQKIYEVSNATLGAHEIFLVPIGPDAEGMRYQAVFG